MNYEDMWYELLNNLMLKRNLSEKYSTKKEILDVVLSEMMRLQIIANRGECSADEYGLPFVTVGKEQE